MKTVILTIPFPGFYESTLSMLLDDAEEQLAGSLTGKGQWGDGVEEPEFPNADESQACEAIYWTCDYRAAHLDIAKAYAGEFARRINADLPEGVAPFPLEFESMDSPREYNFATDRVYMKLPLDHFERMRAAVAPTAMVEILAEEFTERSGFIPFYSSDPEDWADRASSDMDHNEAGTVMLAYLASHNVDAKQDGIETALAESELFAESLSDAINWDKLRERMSAHNSEVHA